MKHRSLFTNNILFKLLGFFSTTPVITIPLGIRDISIFHVLFYLVLLYLVVVTVIKRNLRISRNIRIIDIWLLLAAISCVFGSILLSVSAPDFSRNASTYIFKTLAYLVFALVWANQGPDKLRERNTALLNGIIAGCIANLAWASIDGVGFYLFGRSINNIVFSGYAIRHNIRYNQLSLIMNSGLFRAAGFNSDPAQIGFIAPLIICLGLYKRKYWLIVVAAVGMLASASTTSLVSALVVLAVWAVSNKKVKKGTTRKRLILSLIGIIGVFVAIVLFHSQIVLFLSKAFNLAFGRINSVYFSSDLSTNIRWKYFVYAPRAWLNLGIKGLLGLGFGTGSYGFVSDPELLNKIGINNNFPYDPENTYVSYLLDTGIIGIVIFLIVIIRLLKHFKNKVQNQYAQEFDQELKFFSGILATALSMFFYHYILFAPQMLFIISALSRIDYTTNYDNREMLR